MKNVKKLHLNIKLDDPKTNLIDKTMGSVTKKVKRGIVHTDILRKARALGLTTHVIHHHSETHIEAVFEGDRKVLWEMVGWAKTGPVLTTVDEVLIKFTDFDIETLTEEADVEVAASELVGVR
ncbi:MAG: acylphosphatase [Patescibacteria group bacterium]